MIRLFDTNSNSNAGHDKYQIWHADALQQLAEPTGMRSIRYHYMQYSLNRAEIAAYEDRAKTVRAFQIIGTETYRVVSGFCFQMVQMCCALEVHISLVLFDADRVGGLQHLDPYRVIMPMVGHFLSAVLQVADATGRLWTLWCFRTKIAQLADSSGDEGASRAQHNSWVNTLLMAILSLLILLYSCVLVDVALKLEPILMERVFFEVLRMLSL